MTDLIKRLEEAREPTRELDVAIAIAAGWDIEGGGSAPFAFLAEKFGFEWAVETASEYISVYRSLPAYTSSVDAALSLVPDGWQRESLSEWDAPPEEAHKNERQTPWARATLCGTSVHRGRWGHSGGDGRVDGEAQSLALAICIAALKAKLADAPTPRPEAGEGVE